MAACATNSRLYSANGQTAAAPNRALAAVAYVVVRHGEEYGPLLERLLAEKSQMEKRNYRDKAHDLLAAVTREVNLALR